MLSRIEIVPSLDVPTPARVIRREGGILIINASEFFKYSEPEQRFIIAHELGHLNENTGNEEAADFYALKHTFGKYPGSIRGAASVLIKAHKGQLNERILNFINKAALYDFTKFNNTKALNLMQQIHFNTPEELVSYFISERNKFLQEYGFENIDSLSNQKRDELAYEFMELPHIAELINRKNDFIGTAITGAVSLIGGIFKSVKASKEAKKAEAEQKAAEAARRAEEERAARMAVEKTEQSKKTLKWGLIGGGGLLLVVLVVVIIKKMRRK